MSNLPSYFILLSLFLGIVSLLATRFNFNFFPPQYRTGHSLPDGLQVFTKEQLAAFDGSASETSLIYLAIVGHVYDVSRGRQFYGPSGGYSGFAAKDGTRAFVSGNFTTEGLVDSIEDMEDSQLLDIWEWKSFYDKEEKYTLKGYVQGIFFDANGIKLPSFITCETRVKQMKLQKQHEKDLKRGFPTCNSRWEAGKGSKLWCEDGRVPRKWFIDPSKDSSACHCFAGPDVVPKEGTIEEYDNCEPSESTCVFPPSEDN